MKTNRKCTCDCENVIVYIFFNKNIVSLFTPYFRVNRDSLKKTIKNEMKITEVPIFRNSRVNMDLTYLKKKHFWTPGYYRTVRNLTLQRYNPNRRYTFTSSSTAKRRLRTREVLFG